MTDYVTDLDQLKILAEQHRDDFEVLSYMLDFHVEVSDEDIDSWVDQIAEPIVAGIDCTQCANCCSSLGVYLTEDDAKRLASGIDVSLDSIITTYIDREAAQKEDEWGKFKTSPCVFLKNKLCTVYEYRPNSCRTYPVMTPDFRWTIDEIREGAEYCPIIFNVLLTLYKRINDLY